MIVPLASVRLRGWSAGQSAGWGAAADPVGLVRPESLGHLSTDIEYLSTTSDVSGSIDKIACHRGGSSLISGR